MRGAAELIAGRFQGCVPDAVFLYLDMPRMPEDVEEFGRLFLDESERASGVDLRCIVGLPVFVSGVGARRTASIAKACAEAGATRVVATTFKSLPRGCYAIVEVADTEGFLSWKP